MAAGRYGSFRARRNAIVLQYHLVYCDTLLLRVAASVLSFASFREGIKTGDGSVVASILMPLYFLTVAFGVLLPRPLVTIGAAFLLAGVKLGVCMSVCLHRWAAHGAFSCSYPFAVVLSVLGCLATQGGPVWWGSKHRVHHAYCEKARDPHSPRWRLFVVREGEQVRGPRALDSSTCRCTSRARSSSSSTRTRFSQPSWSSLARFATSA